MTALTDTFTLSNGVEIPKIGFGTWQIPDGARGLRLGADALRVGYRHIDTARAYGNEASVGRAIRDSGIPRDDIFVTTKLPAEVKDHDEASARASRPTMAALDLDYVDLYLIHAPWPWTDMGSDHREGNIAVWKAMEEIYEAGARGRSASPTSRRRPRVAHGGARTSCRMPTRSAGSSATLKARRRTTARPTASSSRATRRWRPGAILDNAGRHSASPRNTARSVAQICIRYLLEKDVLPLPKTTHPVADRRERRRRLRDHRRRPRHSRRSRRHRGLTVGVDGPRGQRPASPRRRPAHANVGGPSGAGGAGLSAASPTRSRRAPSGRVRPRARTG